MGKNGNGDLGDKYIRTLTTKDSYGEGEEVEISSTEFILHGERSDGGIDGTSTSGSSRRSKRYGGKTAGLFASAVAAVAGTAALVVPKKPRAGSSNPDDTRDGSVTDHRTNHSSGNSATSSKEISTERTDTVENAQDQQKAEECTSEPTPSATKTPDNHCAEAAGTAGALGVATSTGTGNDDLLQKNQIAQDSSSSSPEELGEKGVPNEDTEGAEMILLKFVASQDAVDKPSQDLELDVGGPIDEDSTGSAGFAATFLQGHEKEKHRKRRRCCLILLAMLLLVLLIIVFSALALRNRRRNRLHRREDINSQVNSNEKDEQVAEVLNADQNEDVQVAEVQDLQFPTAAPTVQRIQDSFEYKLIAPHIEDTNLLMDTTTPQGRAFDIVRKERSENGEGDGSLLDAASDRILQRFALFTVYFGLNGPNWDMTMGWADGGEDECSWFGVRTCRMQSHGGFAVTNIVLVDNGLSGNLPTEICLLSKLNELSITDNMVEGEIPSCLTAHLSQLQVLDLENNIFTGTIPKGIFVAQPQLEVLILADNFMEGALDIGFASPDSDQETASSWQNSNVSSSSLEKIDLHRNRFDGTIPEEFSSMSNLKELVLHSNWIEGDLDPVCDSLHQLEIVSADCMTAILCSCCTDCF